jgi:cytochrome c biogenesis protein CcmG/thiol:disulfide interchange protein DsbE
MRRFAVPGVISLVVLALLAVLAFGVAHEGPSNGLAALVSRGKEPKAPNSGMRLQVLGSTQRQTLSGLRGKVVLVNVFAGWCPPCQTEAPILRHAQQLLAQHGGTVLGVTWQDSSSDAVSYMRSNHLSFPVFLDPGDTFVAPYGVTGPPETFIVNRQGKVVAARTFQLTAKWVDTALAHALGLKA